MRIVFHGELSGTFAEGFADLLTAGTKPEIAVVPDVIESEGDRRTYAGADVIVSFRFDAGLPRPERLRLLHVPGAGTDAVDTAALPASAVVCNCFGHEQTIAEYSLAAMIMHEIPFAVSEARLRTGDWSYRGGTRLGLHGELAGSTIGILGYGRIGRAVAVRAKAFEMRVHAANRSPVAPSPFVDRSFPLDRLTEFWPSAKYFVLALPLTPETKGIVGRKAFELMPRDAFVVNIGRGALADERAFYDALKDRRIAGAAIDTWYQYPSGAGGPTLPSAHPFHELPNVLMTPHFAGWSTGTIRRRQAFMAENISRLLDGKPCTNVVWPVPQSS